VKIIIYEPNIWAGWMDQVTDYLPSKQKTFTLNPTTAEKNFLNPKLNIDIEKSYCWMFELHIFTNHGINLYLNFGC
jgi:hypothetical protein